MGCATQAVLQVNRPRPSGTRTLGGRYNVGMRKRWLALLLAAVAVGLVPWTLWLTISLPARHVARHYDVAWVGFDVVLAVSFAVTAYAFVRAPTWLAPAAAVTGTLRICDAWFDVVTSGPGWERAEAALLAGLAELPLAALCVWIVLDAHRARRAVSG